MKKDLLSLLLFKLIVISLIAIPVDSQGNTISENQQRFIKQYQKQKNIPTPQEMLLNKDPEPDLTKGFVSLYNGKNLDGWTSRGGFCKFEAQGEAIIGTHVAESPSTYLTTEKDIYADFIFTAEIKWEVDANTGIIFRSRPFKDTVQGPQAEMEEASRKRFWSGGIYGQDCGGWFHPLWLDSHKTVRHAMKPIGEWNRITIEAKGHVVKTWLNGVPAAHWVNDRFLEGFFGLQVHSGQQGIIHFRNIKVKELDRAPIGKDLFASGDFSAWSQVNGKPVPNGWTFTDGVVHRKSKSGDIITKDTYQDFEFFFDWKISEAGNSGVKYRTRKKLGLEYQILDDANHKDNKNPTHRTGSLYDLFAAPDSKTLKKVGNWNNSRIIAKGDYLQHWLNGEKVTDIKYGSAGWQKRFSESKYAKHEGFGSWAGSILLQDHNDEVWFRHLKVRSLDKK